ncbi:ATPase family AAA domain-containing protein 5 isoform X2 [Sphaerodactylus townsendi]|uniref:ATPase family AAA domain-containing protein 5 isoform X2 n=1 Tax=Sphaerodactylus townsendi TaxID=933632 RepID=UPI0020268D6E|nr:ATPase family AAA domain-containing protein 5 isoform X2 [Sphaerodactylus townsendi]
MVGPVAMAAAAAAAASPTDKDGDSQPYKKRREDDSSVKAITNYFSPLSKNMDKVLSPPKPNKIMDYFKKTSPFNDSIASPVTEKERKTSLFSLENYSKPLTKLKRRGKRCNLNNKLKHMRTLEHDTVNEINNDDGEECSLKEENLKTNLIDQNAAELLDPSVEGMLNNCSKNLSNTVSLKDEEIKQKLEEKPVNTNFQRPKKRKHKNETEVPANFISETQLSEQSKDVEERQLVSTSEPENKNVESILGLERNTHETLRLNDSTVTVSFEDFVKSQRESKVDQISEVQTPNSSVALGETASSQMPQLLPLKKVTVLAEIHPVPPRSFPSRKIASIFLKHRTKAAKTQSRLSAPEVEFNEQMIQKRKSNVVIAEEELELAELETPSSANAKTKCTTEERYQFMKAFRQPELDTVKNGTKKAPAKQKEVGENPSRVKVEIEESGEASNKKLENEVPEDYVGGDSLNTGKNLTARVKNKKLSRKRVMLETKGEDVNVNENQDGNADCQTKVATSVETQSKLPQGELRRSPRQKKSEAPMNITPEKGGVFKAAAEDTSGGSPLQSSTPKANNNSCSKSDLYKAEMVTELFDSKSPIRMKFTRISTSEGSSQQSPKMNAACNISKAKKLIEKAKALQHNKARTMEETSRTPLRRSSRQQALAEKKNLQNLEESVIILDSSLSSVPTVLGVVEKQKSLQNLNDVLGKKAGNAKTTKKSNGKEKVSSLIRKKVQKPVAKAIMISDESSEDESENSQDDEQFKARRTFLMSGLPESLKRQIAKKAATLEAYSASDSCFRAVVHVQQEEKGYLMWRLTPPSCPLLTNLREKLEAIDIAQRTFSLGEFSVLKTQSNCTDSAAIMPSGWRPALSEALRNYLLEDVKASNPQFPAKRFFDLLLKKQTIPENNKQVNKCETIIRTDVKPGNQREDKKKRKTEDCKHKRRKQAEKADAKPSDSVSKELCETQASMENKIHTVDSEETDVPEIIAIEDDAVNKEIISVSDSDSEDVLWTEKYQPQNSDELIGNTAAIKKLHRWLSEWKKRAYLEENRAQKEEKCGSQEESLDSMDFKDDKSYSDGETDLCNTMLLSGPSGVGKTAAVYACAQELGFKIFEVNASCQRSGRQILSQLKEATQSHQVAKQGVNSHKPCFFNSTKSPRKFSPRKEWSPKKLPGSPRKAGLKQGLASKTLTSYFKVSSKEGKAQRVENNKERKEMFIEDEVQIISVKRGTGEEESRKKSATSLILFEEVDIIFDEDVGFLNAVKTFMATTKRPVVLTTNDPSFSLIFDGLFEEIIFTVPSPVKIASYLQVLCLAENLQTDVDDFAALLTTNHCDVRQSILHLQFWVRSGGGYLKGKNTGLHDNKAHGTEQIACADGLAGSEMAELRVLKMPKCDTGCIETLLGLKNIFLPSEDLLSFLKHDITSKEEWSKLVHLLTEFQMKNIDFIYSNLELILPLPVAVLSEPAQMANPPLKTSMENRKHTPLDGECTEEVNPMKKSKRTKLQRKMVLLDDSDLFESELNYSGFVTLPSDVPGLRTEGEKGGLEPATESTVTPRGGTKAESKGSAHASQCLNSLAEFVENMSLLDYCLNNKAQKLKQSCEFEEFVWTKGKIKNGLSDEFSEEHPDWWSSKSCSDLKATTEALAFQKCFKGVSKALRGCLDGGKDGLKELTLHISKEQAALHFGQLGTNSSIHQKAQKRQEIIKAAFCSRAPFSLSHRQASIVEYLPALRNICKAEKQKEKGKTKRRFLHYLEGIHCDFPREVLNSLAADFP